MRHNLLFEPKIRQQQQQHKKQNQNQNDILWEILAALRIHMTLYLQLSKCNPKSFGILK